MKYILSSFVIAVLSFFVFKNPALAQTDWTSKSQSWNETTVTLQYPSRLDAQVKNALWGTPPTVPVEYIDLHSESQIEASIYWHKTVGGNAGIMGYGGPANGSLRTYGAYTGTYFENPFGKDHPYQAFVFHASDYDVTLIDWYGNFTSNEWIQMASSIYFNPQNNILTPVPVLTNGTLIKAFGGPEVYRMEDGVRRPFINEESFYMWYSAFKNIREIAIDELSAIPLGSVMLPPATTWIKIQSMPDTFEVQQDGKTLRWISSEDVARQMRGNTWNQNIHTIDVTLWQKFEIGQPIQ